ncbi:hypothetical protein FRB99_004702 [Tulasnella sp. 403]|nr:hypothetical protein FRB99_004702 [Tulasnella sp. 403]
MSSSNVTNDSTSGSNLRPLVDPLPGQQKPEQQPTQQPGYLKQAYDGATSLATTAANTLSNAFSGMTIDSSTQHRNQQSHVGGVDDLGTKSDSDVARLPEERANPDPLGHKGTDDVSLDDPAISDPATIQSRLNARNPPQPYPEQRGDKDYRNHLPHVGGVGDLGTNSEADVVRLPEEKGNPDPFADQAPTSTLAVAPTSSVAPTSQAPSSTTPPGQQKSWDHRGHAGTATDATQPGHSGGVTGSNHDVDHGLGMPHKEHKEVAQHHHHIRDKDQNVTGAHEDGSPTDDKGPSRMDKLRGNLMIAKGKLTKGHEEVEQGKRLKTTGKSVDPEQGMQEGK